MYNTEVNSLITFLKWNSNISNIFWDRVFYVQPVKDPTDTALYINVLSENRKQIEKESLVDFRVVSFDTSIWPWDIQSYIDTVKDELEKNHLEIWDWTYYQIDIQSDVFVAHNKNHFEWVFTIIFKKTR